MHHDLQKLNKEIETLKKTIEILHMKDTTSQTKILEILRYRVNQLKKK